MLDSECAEFLVWLDEPEEVRRYVLQEHPTTIEQARLALERIGRISELDPRFGFWMLRERDSGNPIGWIHLRPSPIAESRPELGYRLHPKFWNRGYATEASREIVRYAFEELQLPQVIAIAFSANTASTNVMKKVGMKFSHDVMYQSIHQLALYSMTSQEWLQSSPGR